MRERCTVCVDDPFLPVANRDRVIERPDDGVEALLVHAQRAPQLREQPLALELAPPALADVLRGTRETTTPRPGAGPRS